MVRLAPAIETCQYCNAVGHNEQLCRKKEYDSKICGYCHMKGHSYEDCYSLGNAIRNGLVSKEKSEKTIDMPSSPVAQPVVYSPYTVPPLAPVAYQAAAKTVNQQGPPPPRDN
jgi:hypothetical protein